jgi:hypothetical protein
MAASGLRRWQSRAADGLGVPRGAVPCENRSTLIAHHAILAILPNIKR